MAMPSAVTVGSLGFVIAAGVGLVAISASASDNESATSPTTVASPTKTGPTKARPMAGANATPHAPTATPRKGQGSERSAEPKQRQPDAVPKVLVEVYNNSGIPGLAAQKAAILQGAGWSVAATDNWYGDIPANTVYYPPHLKEQAVQLAKVLGVQRRMPAVAPMQFDRLTVVLTAS
jgi:hypothetical protein